MLVCFMNSVIHLELRIRHYIKINFYVVLNKTKYQTKCKNYKCNAKVNIYYCIMVMWIDVD